MDVMPPRNYLAIIKVIILYSRPLYTFTLRILKIWRRGKSRGREKNWRSKKNWNFKVRWNRRDRIAASIRVRKEPCMDLDTEIRKRGAKVFMMNREETGGWNDICMQNKRK